MCDETVTGSISHELKAVHHVMQRHIQKSAADAGIDRIAIMHGWIIAYLDKHRDEDIYQKDIEAAFAISRSTVTGIVKNMEQKGYIRRVSVDSDARLKKLVLTEEGERVHGVIRQTIIDNENRFNNLLSERERDILIELLRKLRSGIETLDSKGATA